MNPTSKQKSFRAFGALFLHFHVQGPPAPPQNYKLPPPPLLSPLHSLFGTSSAKKLILEVKKKSKLFFFVLPALSRPASILEAGGRGQEGVLLEYLCSRSWFLCFYLLLYLTFALRCMLDQFQM